MSKARSPEDMKEIAAMLACPHQWGPPRKVRLMDKGKPKDGDLFTCSLCGTHRMKYADGTGSLFGASALSDKPTT